MKTEQATPAKAISDKQPAQSGLGNLLQSLLAYLPASKAKRTTVIALCSQADPIQSIAGLHEQGRVARCLVILPNDWIEWASIPWLGPKLREEERLAVQIQRLNALYGLSTDRHVAVGKVRFGCGQWIAATARSCIQGLQESLTAKGFTKVSLIPAHVAAWRAYLHWSKKGQVHTQPFMSVDGMAVTDRLRRDHLFATLDGSALTILWQRYVASSKAASDAFWGPSIGIRNLSLDHAEGKDEEWSQKLVRCLHRETILQRLTNPRITVVLRQSGAASKNPASSEEDETSAVNFPPDWEVFKTPDWQLLTEFKPVAGSRGVAHDARPMHGGTRSAAGQDLELNFAKPSADILIRPTWGSRALGLALLCSVMTGVLYQRQSEALFQLQEAQVQSASDRQLKAKMLRSKDAPQSAWDRAKRAQLLQVHASIDIPWESLFQCIESSVNSDITLSQIQPDAHAGDLVMAGDAKTFKAIGAMVIRLEENAVAPKPDSTSKSTQSKDKPVKSVVAVCRDLRMPYLSSFQVNEQDPQRALHFEVRAQWVKRRAALGGTDPLNAFPKLSNAVGGEP